MTSNPNSLVGEDVTDVPTIDPDESCNGKRFTKDGKFEGYCDNPAGEGTDHEGRGRCAECAGNSTGPQTEAGKLKAARNGAKHNLTADPFNYHESLDDPEEGRFVLEAATAIERRIKENTGEIDFLDEVLARRMAVQLHIATKASEHIADEGLFERIFTPDGQIEVENRMLDHIRQFDKDLVRNLERIGATKASDGDVDVLEYWRASLTDG